MDYSEKLVVKGLKAILKPTNIYSTPTTRCYVIQPIAMCVTALWLRQSWEI